MYVRGLVVVLLGLTVVACGGVDEDATDTEGTSDELNRYDTWEAPIEYAEGRRLSQLTPRIVERLRAIHADGSGDDDSFIKVGDSITFSTSFLNCLATTELADPALEETRVFFDPDAWQRRSLASTVGWHVTSPLVGSPTPVAREVRAMKPAFAVVMLGTNDLWEGVQRSYERNLRRLVVTLADQGIVPILSTIPPIKFATQNAVVPSMNRVVRKVAAEAQIPLMDYHLVLQDVPKYGLSGDGIHPFAARSGACDFSDAGLRAGYNQRNLLTLEALDGVRRAVLGDL